MIANTVVTVTKVYKMYFKHTIRGFSNYLFKKGGYVVRLNYVTNHKHYKGVRLVSYSKSDKRLTLYDDKGKKQRLSKIAIKKRGLIILDEPLFIPMTCDIDLIPF
mgnify:CR=1 FL=1|tara:strand:- start:355 stop:669 length:315 start_codon:yes stop_codon:yes gene_type:complete